MFYGVWTLKTKGRFKGKNFNRGDILQGMPVYFLLL